MKYTITMIFLVLVLSCSGCVLTKVVTVPMRIGSAAISVVPIAGNAAHSVIDDAAEAIDDIPL